MRLLVLAILIAGCGDPPPDNGDMGCMVTGTGGTTCNPIPATESLGACMHAASDYEPRQNMSMADTWPACISDDNTFHLIGMGAPASASRIAAFETMAKKLWDNPNAPTPADFLSARDDYSTPQGLGSRVERRQDIHYPEVPGGDKFACQTAGVPAMYPDRCGGPGRLLPIVNDAFQKGLACEKPRVQAERLEAALLWFFYLSTLSEIWTCGFDDIEDCDAAWGYYNGAAARGAPIGLGRYMKTVGAETYDRGFDGILAQRCWRDIDKATPSTDKARETLASDQLDKAQLRGIALIMKQRLAQLACSAGEYQEAHFAFLQLLGERMDRSARALNAAQADVLKAQWAKASAAQVDVAAATNALNSLYACP